MAVQHNKDEPPTQSVKLSAAKNMNLISYLKNPAVWLAGISFALIGIGDNGVAMHEVSFITDMKIPAVVAASALGFTFGIGAINRLSSGWLAERVSSRYVSILFLIIEIIGMLILLQANTMSRVWLFVVVYGLGAGASTTLLPIVTREIFGTENFSVVFGFTNVLFVVGYALGVPLAGFMFDMTGSYYAVFIIVISIYVIAILTLYFAFGVKPKPIMKYLNQ